MDHYGTGSQMFHFLPTLVNSCLYAIIAGHLYCKRRWFWPEYIASRSGRYKTVIFAVSLVFSILYGFFTFYPYEYVSRKLQEGQIMLVANRMAMFSTLCTSEIFLGFFFLLKDLFVERQKQYKAQILVQQMQLGYLRSQLNPHFLFNTLNNLYGISLRHPDRTPQLIMQLAQMMHYQLDNRDKEKVPVSEELDFIESYVALEKIRVAKRCKVSYQVSGAFEGMYIAPMILITFIENAFKHGTEDLAQSYINVNITFLERVLYFNVTNSKPSEPSLEVSSMGIGLKNTLERLDLLYRDAYRYEVADQAGSYGVNLVIELFPSKKNGKRSNNEQQKIQVPHRR